MSEFAKRPTIADLNDAFRRSGQRVFTTPAVGALDSLPGLKESVRTFDTFTDDPHNEHDFGELNWEGELCLWKIDYYDRDLKYPADPLAPDSQRILTISFM